MTVIVVGKLVGDYYRQYGIIFHKAVIFGTSTGFGACNGPFGHFGDGRMTFDFVEPGTRIPGSVSRVGFSIGGPSATSAFVGLFGVDGILLGRYKIHIDPTKERFHGFKLARSSIARVVVEGEGYVVDSVQFDTPVGAVAQDVILEQGEDMSSISQDQRVTLEFDDPTFTKRRSRQSFPAFKQFQ
jgi:hypothetical protein